MGPHLVILQMGHWPLQFQFDHLDLRIRLNPHPSRAFEMQQTLKDLIITAVSIVSQALMIQSHHSAIEAFLNSPEIVYFLISCCFDEYRLFTYSIDST